MKKKVCNSVMLMLCMIVLAGAPAAYGTEPTGGIGPQTAERKLSAPVQSAERLIDMISSMGEVSAQVDARITAMKAARTEAEFCRAVAVNPEAESPKADRTTAAETEEKTASAETEETSQIQYAEESREIKNSAKKTETEAERSAAETEEETRKSEKQKASETEKAADPEETEDRKRNAEPEESRETEESGQPKETEKPKATEKLKETAETEETEDPKETEAQDVIVEPDWFRSYYAVTKKDKTYLIRQTPSDSAVAIAKVSGASIVFLDDEVRDEEGQLWYRIHSGELSSGYIKDTVLDTGEYARQHALEDDRISAEVVKSTDLLQKAGSGKKLDSLKKGEQLTVKEAIGEYLKVVSEDGTTGYVAAADVEVSYTYDKAVMLTEAEETEAVKQKTETAASGKKNSGKKAEPEETEPEETEPKETEPEETEPEETEPEETEPKEIDSKKDDADFDSDDLDEIRERMVSFLESNVGQFHYAQLEVPSYDKGVDCSGLMMLVYKDHGFHLARCSYEQAEMGKAISKDQLKPGDLVFYARSGGPSDKIGHVMMYRGDGTVIGIGDSKGVKIRKLTYHRPLRYVNILDYYDD